MEYSLKGRFHYGQNAHGIVSTMDHSSPFRVWHVALLFSAQQWSFQEIDSDTVMDTSLKSIKGSLHWESNWWEIEQEHKKIREVKIY